MDEAPEGGRWLVGFAAHLRSRQEAILLAWRGRVDADPQLTASVSLPRTQFNDHIPGLLEAFEERLRSGLSRETTTAAEDHKAEAEAHGLQRWQQGYRLREVVLEWGHLQWCLLDELQRYAAANPSPVLSVLHTAYRAVAELCSEGVCESTTQYFHLRQAEAVGHVRDLNQTLAEVRELERQRAELWRQAAHDLRGNIGVVANATAGLTLQAVPEAMRETFFRLLQKNVSSVHSMLDDVMSLARLQAGQEQRRVGAFDASHLLREACEAFQPMALERSLFLRYEGVEKLEVRGDSTKVQRIAQNLILNALKYTVAGGVTVDCGASRSGDAERWMLVVRDTGPGYHAGPGAPIAKALEAATRDTKELESQESAPAEEASRPGLTEQIYDGRAVQQERGEGIGLSIVKRLCDLLDASIELESAPGEGTTFRIIFPRSYPPSDEPVTT